MNLMDSWITLALMWVIALPVMGIACLCFSHFRLFKMNKVCGWLSLAIAIVLLITTFILGGLETSNCMDGVCTFENL